MGKYDKFLVKILGGASDANISFDELRQLLSRFGFDERIRGVYEIGGRSIISLPSTIIEENP